MREHDSEDRKTNKCMISGRVPKRWLQSDHVGCLWGINNVSKFIRKGEKRSEYILASQWLRVNMGVKNS